MVAGPISEPTIGKQLFCRRQNFKTADLNGLPQMLREMADFIEHQEPDDTWSVEVSAREEWEGWDGAVIIGGINHPRKPGYTIYYPEQLP